LLFDAARARILLFGGTSANGAYFCDTWEWDGENWTQVAEFGPGNRTDFGLAHDAARGRVVLFGGNAGSNGSSKAQDTWEWDGESWTQMAESGPPSRDSHTMAFDSVRNRTILFGGRSENGAELSEATST
jgi:hypothetical protein